MNAPNRFPPLPIVVRGAREHNLKDVNVVLPRNQFICFTGVSGSGKSSLAFDTLYAEGQRRYLESLSTYARQFVGQLPKPDVDLLSGLSPAISISQKSTGHNPRSTVGTITELTDFLRVLYARCGTGFCPRCDSQISSQTRDQMVDRILSFDPTTTFLFMAPVVRGQKGEHKDLLDDLRRAGFNRVRIDGTITSLSDPIALERYNKHNIELIVDRIAVSASGRQRIAEAVDNALRFGEGTMLLSPLQKRGAPTNNATDNGVEHGAPAKPTKRGRKTTSTDTVEESGSIDPTARDALVSDPNNDIVFSQSYACAKCGISYAPPTPQLLSFNSPQGACRTCDGLGSTHNFAEPLLITDPTKSIKNGGIELIGKMTSMPKWMRRAISSFSKLVTLRLKANKDLITVPIQDLEPEQLRALLYGMPSVFVHCERSGSRNSIFAGICRELIDIYGQTSNPMFKARFEKYMRFDTCPNCEGTRLNAQARSLRLKSLSSNFRECAWKSLGDVSRLSILECADFFSSLELDSTQTLIAEEALKEIRARLQFLVDVGLGYLSLDRTAPTLSGGESQRIRLASQIGAGLVGVLYVLDEPSIGLHPRDNDRLLASLKRLRDLGNTLIVVEHDEDTMRAADTIVDFGPGPGVRGGELISIGTLEDVANNPRSLTGNFLSRRTRIERPEERRKGSGKVLTLRGCTHNNLKNLDVDFPLGCLIAVTGVSGSGKSSLVSDILTPALRNALNRADDSPGAHQGIHGLEHLDKIIDIDQSPIGRTPRSNPATYTKVFDEIRDLFAELPESKRRGFGPGTFSFNTEQGRCTACDGHGALRLDMEFLADLWVPCAVCEGKRYSRSTLQVLFKGKSIADCLDLDIQQALEHFSAFPKIVDKLATLNDVGLEYLKLGQPSPTLSGGEAQRIKLSRELCKRSTGKTLYVLDEPTTGLHFHDIQLLLRVLQSLVQRGNTVVVVEHNLDLIQAADWIIDLGPEGGAGGGRIVATGTPEEIANDPSSFTGQSLKKYFDAHTVSGKKTSVKKTSKRASNKEPAPSTTTSPALEDIHVVGAKQHNLKDIELTIPRNAMTVFCGHSGSGKTSMAMNTIYAEGQRRFVESLSSYTRQFVGQMPKPVVDRIDGLSPAVAIEQRGLSHTPRSTVGTVTEIYDYLRVFFARLAQMHCTQCDQPVQSQTIDQIVDRWLAFGVTSSVSQDKKNLAKSNGSKTKKPAAGVRVLLLARVDPAPQQELSVFFEELKRQGYARVRINGQTYEIDSIPALNRKLRYTIQVVVDRLQLDQVDRKRLTDSIATALQLGNGFIEMAVVDLERDEPHWDTHPFSLQLACHSCGISFSPLTPHHFSFNTGVGWCESCQGLGVESGTDPAAFMDETRSLIDGGLLIWPNLSSDTSRAMIRALGRQVRLPIEEPLWSWTFDQKAILLRGLNDQEVVVQQRDLDPTSKSDAPVMFYKFHGVYPSLEKLSNANPAIRLRLSRFLAQVPCSRCEGSRIGMLASRARLRGLRMADVVRKPIGELLKLCQSWDLDANEKKIAGELMREITHRLQFLVDVGLDYLTISRSANSLSGGESQRIRLASQLGSGLSGVLYVLDEPTIGLHPRDNQRLIAAMHRLRDLGNTLLVVEHDRDVIASSDTLCDFGPGSGPNGGQCIATGSPEKIIKDRGSVTGPYLSGKRRIDARMQLPIPRIDKDADYRLIRDWTNHVDNLHGWITVRGAAANTLKGIDVSIPVGCMTAVTGPSGSGKSSLINDILYPALARLLHRADLQPGQHQTIEGLQHINKVLQVDQSPLGNSPSSNAATYTGVFDHIRQLFSRLPEAKMRGLPPGAFSFNVGTGRCEKCDGLGQVCIQMHFLPDVWIPCDACNGRRYTEEVLAVKFRGHSINDVLNLSIGQARDLMSEIPKIREMLTVLCDVGLEYLSLGQSAPTLSGGEAQRVKLAAELCRPATGRTLYLLDEPTTGLHFDDINKLMIVLDELVCAGNTVVIIEHNLEVIRLADWIIDLGPEAGYQGGELVFAGPPSELVRLARDPVPPPQATSGTVTATAKRTRKSRHADRTVDVHEAHPPFLLSSFVSHTGIALAEWEDRTGRNARTRTVSSAVPKKTPSPPHSAPTKVKRPK